MRHFAIIPLLAASLGAAAQAPAGKAASAAEERAVTSIAECLVVVDLPADWSEAVMVIELAKPGDETGRVWYLIARGSSKEATEPFTPCDTTKPAQLLIEARDLGLSAKRGWTGARLTIHRDGRFGLKYDYPK
jgi:hypothetical protein